jgi:hypothetical protein
VIPPEPTGAPRPSTYEVHPTHTIERYDGMGGAGRIVMSDEQLVSAALRLRGRTYMASDTRSQDAAMVAIAYLDLLKERTPDLKMKPTIQMASGRYFDFLDPDSTPVAIDDIAHALSKLCRFTGHILGDDPIYPIGQHCVLASYQAKTREEAYHALMHDSVESVLTDISSPLKQLLPDYKRIEARCEASFAKQHGFPEHMTPEVKTIDLRMLATEKRDLMPGNLDESEWAGLPEPYDHFRITPWSPRETKEAFLARWAELTDRDAPFWYTAAEQQMFRSQLREGHRRLAEAAARRPRFEPLYPADGGLPPQKRPYEETLSLGEVLRRAQQQASQDQSAFKGGV